MMMRYLYHAIFDYDPVGSQWTVVFPDFDGCSAIGATIKEASSHGADELHAHISQLLQTSSDLPIPISYDSLLKEMGCIEPGSIVKTIRVSIAESSIDLGPYKNPDPIRAPTVSSQDESSVLYNQTGVYTGPL